ncbi:MAG: exodeoxyribonuclease VII large subunit, partial [Candidatus Izemoplasmatales bacterium]|nr:exodeoxyribonuclease VII large subunit [Candidatus Izemoplasmatales bacterium]
YFEESHKVKLPLYPKNVGVITSPTGAAVRDIINVINSRFPMTEIIVYPALVQGVNAKESIVEQIERANKQRLVDVLIIGRGGGSIEDLWAFNEEIVAKAIYNSELPIISAVGHETDFTISDFVADVRASTPSHAAEIAVRNYRDVLEDIAKYRERLELALNNQYNSALKHFMQIASRNVLKNPLRLIESKELAYANLYDRLLKVNPVNIIKNKQERVDGYLKEIKSEYHHLLVQRNSYYQNLIEKLELVNPLNIMKKGFAIIRQDDVIKKHFREIDKNKSIVIAITGGEVTTKIIAMKGKENE